MNLKKTIIWNLLIDVVLAILLFAIGVIGFAGDLNDILGIVKIFLIICGIFYFFKIVYFIYLFIKSLIDKKFIYSLWLAISICIVCFLFYCIVFYLMIAFGILAHSLDPGMDG
ncbi:MAG: hypothetical protein IPM04_12360 [Saprospiraceae bacterium]|jgi:hypothetical protein|nr:hypothetical protein [Candidatus Brachybacter algidus]MBK8748617.1 hypothetical protein [Candidatus Brachybacter algidus]